MFMPLKIAHTIISGMIFAIYIFVFCATVPSHFEF
jgi:hypothetical protein